MLFRGEDWRESLSCRIDIKRGDGVGDLDGGGRIDGREEGWGRGEGGTAMWGGGGSNRGSYGIGEWRLLNAIHHHVNCL